MKDTQAKQRTITGILKHFFAFSRERNGGVYLEKGTFVRVKPGYSYVPDYFASTRHKQIDIRELPEFGGLAKDVVDQGRTLLGYDRLYIIYQCLQSLARLASPSAPMPVAEVGVYKGGSSYFIASSAQALDLNIVLHSFDTFSGHNPEDIRKDADNEKAHTPGFFGDTDLAGVSKYLGRFDNVRLHQGRIQDTSSQVESEKFYFVHLDMDLYAPTRFALDFFSQRLVSRGIVVLDDYGNRNCPGILQAAKEFTQQHRDFFAINTLTGQGVLIKD